jgi:hypothetical protein
MGMSELMPNGETREEYIARLERYTKENLEMARRESARRNYFATVEIRKAIARMENAK